MPAENLLPSWVHEYYAVQEWRHAAAILSTDHPEHWDDLLYVLDRFWLFRSEIVKPGGRRSDISTRLDSLFWQRGWRPKGFKTAVLVDDERKESPTHEVDNFKAPVACDVEWNNKDPFYDRDLNNFRLLFELRALSVGILITRTTELQQIFKSLNRGASYGASTTHWGRLLPRLEGGAGGGCPVLALGIRPARYVDDAVQPERFVALPPLDTEGQRVFRTRRDDDTDDTTPES